MITELDRKCAQPLQKVRAALGSEYQVGTMIFAIILTKVTMV